MKDKYLLSPYFSFVNNDSTLNLINLISGEKFSVNDTFLANYLIQYKKAKKSFKEIKDSINHENTVFLIKKDFFVKEENLKNETFKAIKYSNNIFKLSNHSENTKIVILGVPFGGGNYTSDNTKLFPSHLRKFSKNNNIGFNECDFKSIGISKKNNLENLNYIIKNKSLSDGGDIFVHSNETAKEIHKKITFFSEKTTKRKQIPVFIGGDHSITYSTLKGLDNTSSRPFSVIHFDAHTDIYSSDFDAILELNGMHHHGNFVAKALRLNSLENYYQFGIRGLSSMKIPSDNKLKVIYCSEIKNSIEKIILPKKKKDYYITFDIDVLDPSIAPATATPEPDGLSLSEISTLFDKVLNDINIIGIDIVEINPKMDIRKITQRTAIQIMLKLISYIKI